jgi:hypothetical protein
MKSIFKLSPTKYFTLFIVCPSVILILLGIATMFSFVFVYTLPVMLSIQIIFSLIYNLNLGRFLKSIEGTNLNKSFNLYRFVIYFQICTIVLFTFIALELIAGRVLFSQVQLVLIFTFIPAFILQFYIPRYLSKCIVMAEKVLFGVENDLEKTIIMFTYPIYYNWKFVRRINKIFEYLDRQ